jgi:hypothetical protein
VLSICFRLYSQNRGSPKVVSTAAATIRQAVALLFDHTVAEQPLSPGRPPLPEGLAPGREMAAMLLLQDLMNMCAGGQSSAAWPSIIALLIWEAILEGRQMGSDQVYGCCQSHLHLQGNFRCQASNSRT